MGFGIGLYLILYSLIYTSCSIYVGVTFNIFDLSYRLEYADTVKEFKAGIRKFTALEVCLEACEQ